MFAHSHYPRHAYIFFSDGVALTEYPSDNLCSGASWMLLRYKQDERAETGYRGDDCSELEPAPACQQSQHLPGNCRSNMM